MPSPYCALAIIPDADPWTDSITADCLNGPTKLLFLGALRGCTRLRPRLGPRLLTATRSKPPSRVLPRLRPQLAEHLVLRVPPERTCSLQGPSSSGGESHRLDAPVGVWNTLDHTIPLQEVSNALKFEVDLI